MASIFNALNIGYSGLKTSQIAIDTTGHNIANAQNPDYTRQRVVISPNTPLHTTPGDIGLGAKITEIVRIHDEFVYKRLKDASTDNEYSQFRKETMDEVSTYFPEIDKNGIYNGMQEYFNAWNDFSKNTDDTALKTNLAQQTRTFTSTIRQTREQIATLQNSLDEQLQTAVDEINRLGRQIADINIRINTDEAGGDHANDLRDQRDKLELALSKLVDIAVSKGDLQPDATVDRHRIESGDAYHLSIGGSSFVDGSTFHPLVIDEKEGGGFKQVYYQRQDYEKFDITGYLHGGKVGAILSLRDGDLQNVMDELDSYASSMAMFTNNLYAAHATTAMRGDAEIEEDQTVQNSELPIREGSFYVKVYDIDGNEVAKREIVVTKEKTFGEIAGFINANIDDNGDNVTSNDVDDFLDASAKNGRFTIDVKQEVQGLGYTFAIEEADKEAPTLFAGALGLERFFDGRSAADIRLNKALDENPTRIGGNGAPVAGDNRVANSMIELQYDKIDFYMPADSGNLYTSDTLSGFFRMSATNVADTTASAHASAETSEALLNAVVDEFDSISKVDMDEELTNLMKYQTGYSASAKVITTIDQMIQTLLNIKQ
ncbi:flagellar hook-associated protein FlgK [Hydrogenimonas urashimensis]|uniref:flagellar hook-associated protein FlgK n=1 Tax=Hydrogenimonas urashimensis TaxID=2740515 RepID=UPI001915E940|nr:flagellar hook-associated protein FlgK [Hydrogenimonas urashimensis]